MIHYIYRLTFFTCLKSDKLKWKSLSFIQRTQIIAGRMRRFLEERDELPPDVTATIISWIHDLIGHEAPATDPLPRASQRFTDSQHERGEGSGRVPDDD